MKKIRIVVHLVNGDAIASRVEEVEQEDIDLLQRGFAEILGSSGAWQVSIDGENGSWGIFPKESVLWIEVQMAS